MKNYWTLLFLSIFITVHVQAQHVPTVSGDFTSSTFDQLVTKIEAQTKFHFFYNHSWTDSLKININASAVPVPKLLEDVFAGTNFFFAIDNDNIYITLGRPILTELPTGFFNGSKLP